MKQRTFDPSHWRWLRSTALALVLLTPVPLALAGAQQYEPLADAVREALSAALADAPPEPGFIAQHFPEAQGFVAAQLPRVAARFEDDTAAREFLLAVWYEAARSGLDPTLVLAVIHVESGFRKYAVSTAGARGYMQVMPFWVELIGTPEHNLFHLRTNLRYGTVILRHYLDRENGDLVRALGRYNGSLGRMEYPNLVFAAWKRYRLSVRQ